MPVSRKRLHDFQISDWSESLGGCPGDVLTASRVVNRSQERLVTCPETVDHGPYGTYAEMSFNVDPQLPYLTTPRDVARLIALDVCSCPVPIRNQFWEYLAFGSGKWPRLNSCGSLCDIGRTQALRRNLVPTTVDLPAESGYGLRFYGGEVDIAQGARVFASVLDANLQPVRSIDYGRSVDGVFATLADPFVDLLAPGTSAQQEVGRIIGIQKDVTHEPVRVYAVSLDDGSTTLLATMAASETSAAYSRYYLDGLPLEGGCTTTDANGDTVVQVTAMVKLDLMPVYAPTDYLLIQSIEALICEAQSARYGDMDMAGSKQQSAERHARAIGYLNGLSAHYEGTESASVSFAPFGTARLSRQRIGSLR